MPITAGPQVTVCGPIMSIPKKYPQYQMLPFSLPLKAFHYTRWLSNTLRFVLSAEESPPEIPEKVAAVPGSSMAARMLPQSRRRSVRISDAQGRLYN